MKLSKEFSKLIWTIFDFVILQNIISLLFPELVE